MNQFFKDMVELADRFTSPTPKMFKKARKLGAVLVAGGGAAIASGKPHIVEIAKGAITIGGTIIAVASAAKDDDPKPPAA